MAADPRVSLSNTPMTLPQVVVIAITFGLNALDGFDVLSISFASPGIAAEWGMDRAALGIVLSMELLGMCLGSILLGGVADRCGRRPTILGCLAVMAIGMFMATAAHGVLDLSIWRGIVVAILLREFDWRSVFYFGAALTALCIPLAYWLLPESVHWLTQKQPQGALQRVNRVLARMQKPVVDALPVITHEERRRSLSDVFTRSLLATTIIVTAAYFFHVTSFYFVIKWAPKIIVDMGFPASAAAGVLVWTSVGGAAGGAVFGLLTLRMALKPMMIGILLLSSLMVMLFGRSPADLEALAWVCGIAGFFTNAGIVGLYAIFASAFPTHVRAFGTGIAVGVGRGGAVLSPIIAGFLFNGGVGLSTVAFIMALGSLSAAIVLLFLRIEPGRT